MTKNTLGHLWKQNEEINNAISITTMEDENYESGNMVTPKRSQQNCMILPIECIFCKMEKRRKTQTREPRTFYVCMAINYENDNGRQCS